MLLYQNDEDDEKKYKNKLLKFRKISNAKPTCQNCRYYVKYEFIIMYLAILRETLIFVS